MPDKSYLMISGIIFAVVALLHLVRAIVNIRVQIGSVVVPKRISWGGFFAAALLSVWAFILATQ